MISRLLIIFTITFTAYSTQWTTTISGQVSGNCTAPADQYGDSVNIGPIGTSGFAECSANITALDNSLSPAELIDTTSVSFKNHCDVSWTNSLCNATPGKVYRNRAHNVGCAPGWLGECRGTCPNGNGSFIITLQNCYTTTTTTTLPPITTLPPTSTTADTTTTNAVTTTVGPTTSLPPGVTTLPPTTTVTTTSPPTTVVTTTTVAPTTTLSGCVLRAPISWGEMHGSGYHTCVDYISVGGPAVYYPEITPGSSRSWAAGHCHHAGATGSQPSEGSILTIRCDGNGEYTITAESCRCGTSSFD